MKRTIGHIALGFALLVGSLSLNAAAQAQTRYVGPSYSAPGQYAQSQPRRAQTRISYAQAKSAAMQHYPGSVYLGMQLNGNTYVVRLQISQGRIVDVRVDAVTGRVR